MLMPLLLSPVTGYNNILDWSIDKERLEGNDSQRQQEGAAATGEDGDGEGDEEGGEGGGGSRGANSLDGLFRARDSAGYATPKSR